MLFCFSCQVYLLAQVSCQYHHRFWSYDILFYKGLTRNSEIRNTPVWVLPNLWRLGWAKDTKLGTNDPNKMLLNSEKQQDYSFYCFWVIKGEPTEGDEGGGGGGGVSKITPQIQIMVKLWPYAITRSIVFFRVTIRHFKDEKILLIKLYIMTTTIV